MLGAPAAMPSGRLLLFRLVAREGRAAGDLREVCTEPAALLRIRVQLAVVGLGVGDAEPVRSTLHSVARVLVSRWDTVRRPLRERDRAGTENHREGGDRQPSANDRFHVHLLVHCSSASTRPRSVMVLTSSPPWTPVFASAGSSTAGRVEPGRQCEKNAPDR